MPTVFRVGPYRFFFWSQDCEEPPHVHVQRDRNTAKLWVNPIRLERSGGFRPSELRRIEQITRQYEATILEKWNEHCS